MQSRKEGGQSIPNPETPKPSREELFNPEGRYRIAGYISFPEGEGIFAEKRKKYFDRFLKHNPRIVERLTMGGLLAGEGSEGWDNLAEHNIMAGAIAEKLGKLVGLPEKELKEVTFLGGIHDWDKRKDWKKGEISSEIIDGIEVTRWNPAIIAKSERSKGGPLSVTGNDLTGYEDWDLTRKILRFTDSSLMSTKDFKHNKVVSIEDRFEELAARIEKKSPGYSETEGKEIYGEGKLLFDEIARISKWAEGKIHLKILAEHPKLAEKYPEQGSLYQLVTDQITEDINSMPETIFEPSAPTTT